MKGRLAAGRWSNSAVLNAVDNRRWSSGGVPEFWHLQSMRHQFCAAQQCLLAWEGAPIPRRIVQWFMEALHITEEGVIALANDDPSFSYLDHLNIPTELNNIGDSTEAIMR